MKTNSILTCPHCNFSESLMMTANQCVIFHRCTNCNTVIRPQQGDCCIFCSYGDTPCPAKQS
ncbi:MAG: GDCCVxC domain-containing (seleno)protein [Candidatus Thorarchaeota archaeon]